MRSLYTVLLYLIAPLAVLRLLWRSMAIRGYRERMAERFGWVDPSPTGVAVWVHAVSVGEALAALPMIRALIEQHGEGNIWVTTTTPTGSERVRETLGEQVRHSYAPYDLPSSVSRFLNRVRPQKVIVMETELWPNLFAALDHQQIPLLIANARLSPRSFRGYSKVSGFARSVLGRVEMVAAQSEMDAERFRALGAPRVRATGNIKFDFEPPVEQLQSGAQMREQLGKDRPSWAAVSTHEGEESAALTAHEKVLLQFPDALLVIVPRHPQRFDAVARQIRESGLSHARRSDLPTPCTASVLLGDSLGEMWRYLKLSDVVFVGGSLVKVGGHNVLEPAAVALPVLFGPHMHNFLPARQLLLETDAAIEIQDAADLATQVIDLLSDPDRRQDMGAAGLSAVRANRGALGKLLEQIEILGT